MPGKVFAFIKMIIAILSLTLAVGIMHLNCLLLGYTDTRGIRYRRGYVNFLVWLLNIKITMTGDASLRGGLYVANHRMMIDPVIIVHFINTYIVSKAEVANYPILGNGTKHTGVIFVERDKKDSRSAVRIKIRELLDAGKAVLLFPEGTVNVHPLTNTFHIGSFVEAAEAGVPVVPIALDYADPNVYWRENTSLLSHFIDVFRRRSIICSVHFGTPIQDNDPEALSAKSKKAIDEQLLRMHEEFSQLPT